MSRVACALLGALSAMAFVVSGDGYVGMSDAPASSTSYLWSALALCFAALFFHVWVQRKCRPRPATALFALLFGVLNTFGGILFARDSWAMGRAALLLSCFQCVGQALPMAAALTELDGLLGAPARPWDGGRIARHPMPVLLLCWLPYLAAFYPGTVCWDLGEMVAQFFGQRAMDTWHPVFTTWLIGGCVWLGRLVGSDNLGAALFMLMQTLALAYAFSRALRFLQARGVGRSAYGAALAFFALTPLWGGYAQFISKDTLYTAVLLLFTLSVLRLLRGAPARREAPALFAWGLLSCLTRSNGLYVVLPTAVGVLLFAARGRDRLRVGAALGACLACALLFSRALLPALGIRDETASGLYSVCFQQSARTLRDHADAVTDEEYAEIDRVLDAERLPELYEPWISDPVKYTFRQYGQGAQIEKEALARYRGTWLSMLKKYPLTYAEAFFAGNVGYYAFTPKFEGETYNNQAGNRLVFETYELGDSQGDDPRFLDTTQIAAFEAPRTLLALFARGWRHIPLLSLLYACATYTWTLVGAGLSAAHQRRFRLLVGFLPALFSLGVCLLSPVNDYFRYFLPIAAMTPSLLAAAWSPPARA